MLRTRLSIRSRISTPGGAFDAVGVLKKDIPLYLRLEATQADIFRQREEMAWLPLIDGLFMGIINDAMPWAGTSLLKSAIREAQNKAKPIWEERFYEQWQTQWPGQARYQYQVNAQKIDQPLVPPEAWDWGQQKRIREQISRRVAKIMETNLASWAGDTPTEFFQQATANATRRRKVIVTMEVTALIESAKDWAVRALGRQEFDKIWMTEDDEWVRDTHAEQNMLRIPANLTFPNGCDYPGDPDAPVSETANCRCRCVYVPKENTEELSPIDVDLRTETL